MLNIIDISTLHTGVIPYKDSCNVSVQQICCCSLTCISMPDAYEIMTSHVTYLLAELPISTLKDPSCTPQKIPCHKS